MKGEGCGFGDWVILYEERLIEGARGHVLVVDLVVLLLAYDYFFG